MAEATGATFTDRLLVAGKHFKKISNTSFRFISSIFVQYRSGDHSNSYPYHHEATMMMVPPPPPSESEHAYASVHGVSNYEDLRPATVTSSSLIRHPHELRNNRFQRIEMV